MIFLIFITVINIPFCCAFLSLYAKLLLCIGKLKNQYFRNGLAGCVYLVAAPVLLIPYFYALSELNRMEEVKNQWVSYFIIFSFLAGHLISCLYVRKKYLSRLQNVGFFLEG
ncbi:MAG: hypothetical protein ACJAYS_000455 [Lentimonas sp.]|jgi:hypothetical protein